MISEKQIRKDYDYFKKIAGDYYYNGEIDECIECIKTACTLAKTYYLDYTDDELEKQCLDIAELLCIDSYCENMVDQSSDRVVYYDFFALDNVALTQQYLRALMSWGKEILFISPHHMETSKSNHIINEIESSDVVTYCPIPSGLTSVERIQFICKAVSEFNPKVAFVHTATDDVEGIIAWYGLKYSERFFVESIDHTFWIGAKGFDYYILFRDYGFNVANDYRNIPEEKLLIQMYYPIYDEGEYEGIPEDDNNKVKLISGGRLIKTYSSDDGFFHIVRRILESNPNSIFYYVGGGYVGEKGQTAHIRSLIAKYNLEKRYILLGFRHDIAPLLEHMDIYIGTWPMCGGLMTQMAARAELPIIQYSKDGMGSSADDFLKKIEGRPQIVYNNDEDGFYNKVSILVNDIGLREKEGKALKKCVIDPIDFSSSLRKLVIEKKNTIVPTRYSVDIKQWRDNRIETENVCEHLYQPIIARSQIMRKKKPLKYFVNSIQLIIYSDKKWLLGKVRKRLFK